MANRPAHAHGPGAGCATSPSSVRRRRSRWMRPTREGRRRDGSRHAGQGRGEPRDRTTCRPPRGPAHQSRPREEPIPRRPDQREEPTHESRIEHTHEKRDSRTEPKREKSQPARRADPRRPTTTARTRRAYAASPPGGRPPDLTAQMRPATHNNKDGRTTSHPETGNPRTSIADQPPAQTCARPTEHHQDDH
jgi:hypothetical protein